MLICGECKNVVFMKINLAKSDEQLWPQRPPEFPDLMTPIEAAMFLRLDETGHTPKSACRTLNYWRDRGELKATKYARQVWYLKEELRGFLKNKTV
jgi:hypothetical protein